MVVAFWTDLEVFIYLFFVDNLLAAVAFDPQPLRYLYFFICFWFFAFFKPCHNYPTKIYMIFLNLVNLSISQQFYIPLADLSNLFPDLIYILRFRMSDKDLPRSRFYLAQFSYKHFRSHMPGFFRECPHV